MRTVLSKFDILPSDTDFEQFFRKHLRRADGTIEVRALMIELLGASAATHNPFLPKDPEEFDAQVNLAKAISSMTGQKVRNVSGMTGPAHTRLLLDGTEGEAAEEAKSLLEMASARHAKAATVQGHFAATRVGLGPGVSPQPPAGATPSRPTPKAAQQAHAARHADNPPQHTPHAPHAPHAPHGPQSTRGGKPSRPVSAPPLMQTAQLEQAQAHAQAQAGRSPRAAHGHGHRHPTPQVAHYDEDDDDIEADGQVCSMRSVHTATAHKCRFNSLSLISHLAHPGKTDRRAHV